MIEINASAALADLDKIISYIESVAELALDEIAELGQTTAASKTKGTLAKSIKIERYKLSRLIFADQSYAEYVENGRKAFKAKDNGWLHFYVNGRLIYTKQVKATKPKPFMKPSRTLLNTKSKEIMERYLKALFRN